MKNSKEDDLALLFVKYGVSRAWVNKNGSVVYVDVPDVLTGTHSTKVMTRTNEKNLLMVWKNGHWVDTSILHYVYCALVLFTVASVVLRILHTFLIF